MSFAGLARFVDVNDIVFKAWTKVRRGPYRGHATASSCARAARAGNAEARAIMEAYEREYDYLAVRKRMQV